MGFYSGQPTLRGIAVTLAASVSLGSLAGVSGCTMGTPNASETAVNRGRELKIMPLGDSITDGYNVPGGYRINLWTHLHERGYRVNFVGTQSNGPAELPDRQHQGHSGWRIDEVERQVVGWLQQTQPEIVLLIIGTNDVVQGYALEEAPQRLNALLDDIFQVRPQASIFLGSIPPIDEATLDARVRAYNQAMADLVEIRQSRGDRLYFVDLYAGLTTEDLADGIHPNRQGHDKIARMWDAALAEVLLSADSPTP